MGLLKEKLSTVKEELGSFSKRQHAFMLFAMLCGFFICCEYSIVRPVSNSLFIHSYGAHYFPYAWLAVVPLTLLSVSIYNRLIPKWGSRKLFVTLIFLVMGVNTLMGAFSKSHVAMPFLFYMWKEVYVMMMFQLVWSVIHANVKLSKAKYLYGIFFGVGGLGSFFGSAFPGFFAVAYGSENLLYLTLPVYGCLLFTYTKMSKYCEGDVPKEEREEKGGLLHGIKLISGSRFLIFALLIVMFMQMAAAIFDFQFNDFLEKTFPLKDVRTEFSARIVGLGHILTVSMQFVGAYVIIKWLGFKRSHYLIPTMVALCSASILALPLFPIVGLAFITMKSIDFSIFGVIKEMLYVPLKPDEKFRAKAVIDVFAYRGSKALASLLILFFSQFVPSSSLGWVNVCIAIGWIASVTFGLREYEKMTAAGDS